MRSKWLIITGVVLAGALGVACAADNADRLTALETEQSNLAQQIEADQAANDARAAEIEKRLATLESDMAEQLSDTEQKLATLERMLSDSEQRIASLEAGAVSADFTVTSTCAGTDCVVRGFSPSDTHSLHGCVTYTVGNGDNTQCNIIGLSDEESLPQTSRDSLEAIRSCFFSVHIGEPLPACWR